ncbi:MFS general substrate transporter [Epithele typhae]|uniref:MFS general substrate transporter n=1 Tax=Epithele typhae TaxID=378194 RepID=UPI00200852D2|nr:MFS general substrate transporter [Epithele typhae]KAH9941756.1 MFS general substrate transporter [Epithele typhae]
MSLTATATEVEMCSVRTRSPHPPDEPITPGGVFNGDTRSIRKSLEILESSPPPASPTPEDLATAVPALTPSMRRKAKIQFAVLCGTLFLAGWNDGTTGPLLPRIQSVYHVNYAVVSLIFVFNCIGFVSAAAANVWLTDRLGFGKVMAIGGLAQVIGYCLDAPAPPFPVLVLGYLVNGFGLSLQDAGANGFVASLKDNAATKMGVLHAVYGLGALSAPLVATQFAQLERWSFHFLCSLGLALFNLISIVVTFRFKDQDACLAEIGQTPTHESHEGGGNKYKQMFKLRSLHLLAFFIFIYVGVEVTLGGWIVTYVINLRGGGPSSGYISSGFFGGLTLGRVVLLPVNKFLGDRRAIVVYGLIAIGLELVVWLVPSLIGGAVAVSLVGFLLGPFYPIVMNQSARVLPPRLLTGAIGWIAGFGQAGSAFLPFLTGVLASRVGIQALQPLLVSMMVFMLFLWLLVPRDARRAD